MIFIELSTKEGKFIGNVNELKRVFTNKDGKTCVVGWNNNGYFEIEETYEEVIAKINASSGKVKRL
jgi:sporulation protein YlmC with PRC-barrel domain